MSFSVSLPTSIHTDLFTITMVLAMIHPSRIQVFFVKPLIAQEPVNVSQDNIMENGCGNFCPSYYKSHFMAESCQNFQIMGF